LALAVSALWGCATPRSEIAAGQATLIPNSVSANPFGLNYKLSGIVDLKGRRISFWTWATDCSKGTGALESTVNYVLDVPREEVIFDNLILTGSTPPDRLFHDICAAGLPLATAQEAQLTPEDRRAREERLQMLMRSTLPH
jgi:hypothetical protein